MFQYFNGIIIPRDEFSPSYFVPSGYPGYLEDCESSPTQSHDNAFFFR